jgi:hypothetical protein
LKKFIILLTFFFSLLANAERGIPLFSELPMDVQKDIGLELSYELKLTPTQ